MKNKIIKIPSVNYKNVEVSMDILSSLVDVENTYRYRLHDPNNHLNSLINEYQENIDKSIKEADTRLEVWRKLLGKYYKMTCEKETRSYTYKTTSYIFPYQVIDANHTLWVLEVVEGDNYDGGVKDKNYTVDRDWNYDTYLEEITEEEFRQKAIEATKHVIDRRLHKLLEPKPQYKIINQDEFFTKDISKEKEDN